MVAKLKKFIADVEALNVKAHDLEVRGHAFAMEREEVEQVGRELGIRVAEIDAMIAAVRLTVRHPTEGEAAAAGDTGGAVEDAAA